MWEEKEQKNIRKERPQHNRWKPFFFLYSYVKYISQGGFYFMPLLLACSALRLDWGRGLGDVKWFQSAALVKRYRSVNDYYLDLCLETVTKVESTPRSWRRRRSYGINMYNEYNFFNPIHNLWFILERALGDRSKPWSECCLSGLIQFTVQCIEISQLPAKCSLPCLDL